MSNMTAFSYYMKLFAMQGSTETWGTMWTVENETPMQYGLSAHV